MYDAREIANYYLDISDNVGWPVTNLHLQKILYFCQGYSLCLNGAPLIRNPFEAWPNGPVISVVYDAFKKHGAKPIRSRASILNPDTFEHEIANSPLNSQAELIVQTVFERYGKLSGPELSIMSHEADGAWQQVIVKTEKTVSAGRIIENDLIQLHIANHIRILWRH